MTNDVAIIGVGLHPFGRFEGKSAMEMGVDAIFAAVDDAGVEWKDIQAATGGSWTVANPDAIVGMARVSSVALPLLRRSDHAAIVNTCSAVAHLGVPARAVYATTKGAVLALTLAMAADHVREGIRVNAVAPGTTDTPWVERLLAATDDPAAAAEALRRRQPMGRLVTADEVAHAIAYLASPRSASTTGTILAVDGGMVSLRVATT